MHAHMATATGTAPESRPRSAARVVHLRRRMFTSTEAIILMLSIVCLLAVAFAPAFRGGGVGWAGSATIKVERAESLWSIATEHPIKGFSTAQTVASIREANHLDRSDLTVGQILEVPAPSGSVTAMASR